MQDKPSKLTTTLNFEQDGKQVGYVRLPHSVHRSAYGWLPVPVACIRNGGGPTVLLMAGTHGDEYEGPLALYDLARTLDPLEKRLAQLDTKDFLFDRPGLFEVVLLPQVYNARRFDFGFADKPHISRIERACLGMTEFQRAHPDAQPDNPENTRN